MFFSEPHYGGNWRCWPAMTPRKRARWLSRQFNVRSLAKSALASLIALALAGCTRSAALRNQTLTLSVAASLQNAMADLAPTFERSQPGIKLDFNFGASGTLEQQIERGAPADVFFSAAPKPMDTLASKGLILTDTRRDLL